jgi:hypothetical protein
MTKLAVIGAIAIICAFLAACGGTPGINHNLAPEVGRIINHN